MASRNIYEHVGAESPARQGEFQRRMDRMNEQLRRLRERRPVIAAASIVAPPTAVQIRHISPLRRVSIGASVSMPQQQQPLVFATGGATSSTSTPPRSVSPFDVGRSPSPFAAVRSASPAHPVRPASPAHPVTQTTVLTAPQSAPAAQRVVSPPHGFLNPHLVVRPSPRTTMAQQDMARCGVAQVPARQTCHLIGSVPSTHRPSSPALVLSRSSPARVVTTSQNQCNSSDLVEPQPAASAQQQVEIPPLLPRPPRSWSADAHTCATSAACRSRTPPSRLTGIYSELPAACHIGGHQAASVRVQAPPQFGVANAVVAEQAPAYPATPTSSFGGDFGSMVIRSSSAPPVSSGFSTPAMPSATPPVEQGRMFPSSSSSPQAATRGGQAPNKVQAEVQVDEDELFSVQRGNRARSTSTSPSVARSPSPPSALPEGLVEEVRLLRRLYLGGDSGGPGRGGSAENRLVAGSEAFLESLRLERSRLKEMARRRLEDRGGALSSSSRRSSAAAAAARRRSKERKESGGGTNIGSAADGHGGCGGAGATAAPSDKRLRIELLERGREADEMRRQLVAMNEQLCAASEEREVAAKEARIAVERAEAEVAQAYQDGSARAEALQEQLAAREQELDRLKQVEADTRRRAFEEVRAVRLEVADTLRRQEALSGELAEAERRHQLAEVAASGGTPPKGPVELLEALGLPRDLGPGGGRLEGAAKKRLEEAVWTLKGLVEHLTERPEASDAAAPPPSQAPQNGLLLSSPASYSSAAAALAAAACGHPPPPYEQQPLQQPVLRLPGVATEPSNGDEQLAEAWPAHLIGGGIGAPLANGGVPAMPALGECSASANTWTLLPQRTTLQPVVVGHAPVVPVVARMPSIPEDERGEAEERSPQRYGVDDDGRYDAAVTCEQVERVDSEDEPEEVSGADVEKPSAEQHKQLESWVETYDFTASGTPKNPLAENEVDLLSDEERYRVQEQTALSAPLSCEDSRRTCQQPSEVLTGH